MGLIYFYQRKTTKMRKYIIASLLLGGSITANAQFPTLDSLRNYNNRFIRNSAINAFQNLRLNTFNNGVLNYLDSALTGGGGSGIASVVTDVTLTGNGLSGNPLKVDTNRIFSRLDSAIIKTVATANATPINIDSLYSANNTVVIYDLDVTATDTANAVNSWLKRVIIKNQAGTYTILTSGNIAFLDSHAAGLTVQMSGSIPVVTFTGIVGNVKWVYALRPKAYLSL